MTFRCYPGAMMPYFCSFLPPTFASKCLEYFQVSKEEKRPLTNLIPVLSFPQRPLAFITTKRKTVKKIK